MRQSLDGSDRLVVRKNQEISELNSRLATKDETIAELDEQIDRLESELASREPTQSENLATVGTDLSKVEAADLLNQLKARRKKSKADLADMDAVLELLSQS
ncbi:flagellar alpha dynein [Microcoleus sp. A2-C5]|uniref:flagellar alpha dynein n=1 Tax=Microcoleaceae TaxID=1892252 RepID=UPI002237673B|nr:flagellar alpha dynein [Lyngbya sp. CCAP 1446/10]MCW6053642.1 flagellar alpha dynein [Lyngbya sp. CCAP 1446/10]